MIEPAPRRQLQLAGHNIDYVLQRSARRSIGFTIGATGLRVTAPERLALADIDQAIRSKETWILSKLDAWRIRCALRPPRATLLWVDGAALPYLGDAIILRLHQAARHRTSFQRESGELHVWLTPVSTEQHLKEKVRSWLQAQAKNLFAERLDLYAAKLGVNFHSFALSSAGTRWGSCTVQRKIRLNWRLIHFGLPLLDYVVAHEISHLLEMNHSVRFWATLESIYPGCKGARQALHQRAQELPLLLF